MKLAPRHAPSKRPASPILQQLTHCRLRGRLKSLGGRTRAIVFGRGGVRARARRGGRESSAEASGLGLRGAPGAGSPLCKSSDAIRETARPREKTRMGRGCRASFSFKSPFQDCLLSNSLVTWRPQVKFWGGRGLNQTLRAARRLLF